MPVSSPFQIWSAKYDLYGETLSIIVIGSTESRSEISIKPRLNAASASDQTFSSAKKKIPVISALHLPKPYKLETLFIIVSISAALQTSLGN
jgi:hypothetical protein